MTLTTKGDANRGPDTDPVPVTAVRGRVLFHVAHLGTVRNAIGTGGAGLMLLLLGLIGYAVSQVLSVWRDRRRTATTGSPVLAATAASNAFLLQLLLVTLPLDQFGGLLPHQVALLLRMDLLDEGSDRFTLAVSREPDQVEELVTFLLAFQPLHVSRSDVLAIPACSASIDLNDSTNLAATLPTVIDHAA